MKISTLYVVVPVYNEEHNIEKFLCSLEVLVDDIDNKYDVKIILVDDGSKDKTVTFAKEKADNLQLTILQHQSNMGPGKAFGTAFSYLSTRLQSHDLIVTMEGDNTSRSELIRQMIYRLDEGFDVILASPYMYGGRIENTSLLRVFLSSVANLFVKELLGIQGIFTVSSFFRLYRAPFLHKMQLIYGPEIIERKGFECMTEMIMKMVNMGAKISEIAMVLNTAARVGKSRMNILKTTIGYFSLFLHKNEWKLLQKNNCES